MFQLNDEWIFDKTSMFYFCDFRFCISCHEFRVTVYALSALSQET